MALVAVHKNSQQEIESFNVPDAQWDIMRNEPRGSYVMPTTGWPAILKRSIRGTKFFAYAHGFTGIKPEPESEEHRVIKVAIAQALRAAGYVAQVERSGSSPDGEMWQADVLCDVDGRKIAFEVQLSRQTLEEYERRSDVYRKSGIQPLWLVKHHGALTKAVCYRLQKQGKQWEGYGHIPTIPFAYLDIEKDSIFSIDKVLVRAHQPDKPLQSFAVSEFVSARARGTFDFVEITEDSYDGKRRQCSRWQLKVPS